MRGQKSKKLKLSKQEIKELVALHYPTVKHIHEIKLRQGRESAVRQKAGTQRRYEKRGPMLPFPSSTLQPL